MRVLLINPPKHEMHKENIWKKIDTCLPSLGLAYIAAYIEKDGAEVKILDLVVENFSYDNFTKYLKEFNPDFVGITASTVTIIGALSIAKISKEACPNAKIVLGGAHPTAMPEELLKESFVDFVVRGEGEVTFAELIKSYDNPEKILGISYKDKNGKIVNNDPRPFIEDLDSLPFPAWHLLPMGKYKPSLGNYKRLPAMSMICGRGCPGVCTYCFSKPFGKKIRFRSAKNIIEEMKLLIKNYGIKEISFYDENITTNRQLVQEMCKIIIDEKIDITWACQSRVDTIDEETLKLMKKAGCHQIGFGIESADTEILKNIKKSIPLEKSIDAVKMTQKAGINARANFMFGSPGETEETMEKTIQFAMKINPDFVVFNITTPLPGTEMFDWAKENGYLTTTDWHDYDFSRHIMKLPTIDSKKVEEFYNKSYRRFYFRPKFMIRHLFKTRSFSDITINLKVFFGLILLGRE